MQGHHTVIVSASPGCYVSPAGEELGVDGVVATRLAVGGGGLLTGGYEGKNCRGAEKYARLVVHLRAQGLLSNGGGEQQPTPVGLRQQSGRPPPAQRGRPRCRRRPPGPLGRLRRFPRLSEVVASARGGGDADDVA